MKYLFAVAGVACLLGSAGACATARSAIHEGMSALLLVAGILCMGFAALLEQLQRVVLALKSVFLALTKRAGEP